MSQEVPPADVPDVKRKLFFRCDASIKSPEYTGVFMETGGQINAMAARWQSDFSVSGSETSTVVKFVDKKTSNISIEISEGNYEFLGARSVKLDSDIRLNAMTQRMCAAINGTLATSLSAESSDFLYHILRGGTHYQMGMTYKTFVAHASSLAVSNARVVSVDDDGTEYQYRPRFKKMDKQKQKILEGGAAIAEEYVKAGYGIRQAVVYPPSPMLHKTVFSEIVGINGRGYSLLHSIMDRKAFVSTETLNSLYEAAIACDCCQLKSEVEAFRSATYRPGLNAAMHARTVANATSLIVNVLMSYRADGRNILTPKGADFAAVENWNCSVPRSGIETNDCDGLALLAVSLIRSAVNITTEQENDPKYEYLRSVKNVVHPHYQLALSVIGATAAEANSAKSDHSSVAGHAITVLIPTMSFLRSLSKTIDKQLGQDGPLQFPENLKAIITEARFDALFPSIVTDTLPANEQAMLSTWESAKHEFTQLQSLAIEGTTPSSSIMYLTNPERRAQATKQAEKDKLVFSMAAPNVFRSIKILHVGGSANGSTHVFYRDLVELTFAPDSPLYTDAILRSQNAAASQYVLTADLKGDHIQTAGCTPRHMVMEEYGSFALVKLNTQVTDIIDESAAFAKMDIIPPREPGPLQLTRYQSNTLAKSMEHIKELEEFLAQRTAENDIGANHHCAAYVCAFNTLVHNPRGVKQFVDAMKRVALSGVVDKRIIPGLAHDVDHNEVGMFLHLDIYCAL